MIMNRPDPSIAVRALKSAAPYIRMYKNKVFVIKAGGAVFSDEISTRNLIEQVTILHQVGIKTVLVHGGGPQLDRLQETLGLETKMVNGRRVTDQKSIDVTAMVLNGLINTRILALCRELIAFRRRHPEFSAGAYASLPAPERAWAWTRGERHIVVLNMSAGEVMLDGLSGRIQVCTDRARAHEAVDGPLRLAPFQGLIIERP